MNEAIESIKAHDETRLLLNLAHQQAEFIKRYAALMKDGYRADFERDLLYLIHLTYREAQQPLVKQLTDFVVAYNRPLILERLPEVKP